MALLSDLTPDLGLKENKVVAPMLSVKYFNLLVFYIVVLNLCPLLDLVNLLPGGKPAYIVDMVTLLPILLALHYWRTFSIANLRISFLDLAVTVYLILSILSIVLYLQPGNPSEIGAYFYGIHHFVLPIFLYYAVKTLNHSQQLGLLRLVCYLNITAIFLGIILFFWRPSFYHTFLVEKMLGTMGSLEDWQIFGRMQSYLGSTALGSVAATTIILLVVLKFPRNIAVIFLPITFLGVILTFQRGGFLASLIATLYAIFKIRGTFGYKFLLLIIFAFLMTAGIAYYANIEGTALDRLVDKYSVYNLYYSFDNEKRGYVPGLSYFMDFPMGVGLGGTSSIADLMGLAERGQVVDANFMRILADLGLLGLFSFLAVLWAASRAALKRENGFGWLLLFGLIAAICIGTNTLDSYYISHCFWLFLGVIDTKVLKRHSNVDMQRSGSFLKGSTT